MNLREIKDLIALMNENDLAEIEVETDGAKIKLKKAQENVVVHEAPRAAYAQAPVVAAPAAPAVAAIPALSIKSPMVGTFYSAPAPDAEPYLKVGQKVDVGQVICIVEAMKLMNEIKSEIKGTVTEVHVQSGAPIEFGQILFSVSA